MLSLLESLQRTKGADVVSAHWPIRLVSTRIAIPQQSKHLPKSSEVGLACCFFIYIF